MADEKEVATPAPKKVRYFNRGISVLEVPTKVSPEGVRLKYKSFDPGAEIDVPIPDHLKDFFTRIGSLKEE